MKTNPPAFIRDSLSRRARERSELARQMAKDAQILDEFSKQTATGSRPANISVTDRAKAVAMIAKPIARNPQGRPRLDGAREAMASAIARQAAKPQLEPIVLCPCCRGLKVVKGPESFDPVQPCPVCDSKGFVSWNSPALGPQEHEGNLN